MRQRLKAHQSEESCAVCHREIDPLGFVLENFDPIGRWREHYPVYTSGTESEERRSASGGKIEVDSSGVLPDGTQLHDVHRFKATSFRRSDAASEVCFRKNAHLRGRGEK